MIAPSHDEIEFIRPLEDGRLNHSSGRNQASKDWAFRSGIRHPRQRRLTGHFSLTAKSWELARILRHGLFLYLVFSLDETVSTMSLIHLNFMTNRVGPGSSNLVATACDAHLNRHRARLRARCGGSLTLNVDVECPECSVRAVVLPCPHEDRVTDGAEGQCKHRSKPLNCPTLRRFLSVGRQQLIEALQKSPGQMRAQHDRRA